MPRYTRRQWLATASASSIGSLWPLGSVTATVPTQEPGSRKKTGLDLGDFEPRSMLHVASHAVERARFPVIDIHTHLSFSAKSDKGVAMAEERKFVAGAGESLEGIDRKSLRTIVITTGGTGGGA